MDAKVQVEASLKGIMEQVQVYASSYSLVGGKFDDGTRLQLAEDEKNILRELVAETLAANISIWCGEANAIAIDYQYRVNTWMLTCFGSAVAADIRERPHRFLEEALELAQSVGASRSDAMQLVDYVFGRPAGEPRQEVGGTVLTLSALCTTLGFDMLTAAEHELARVSTPEMIERLRAKNAAKDPSSPLPGLAEGGAV